MLQILVNLLHNAIKFSRRNEEVEVEIEEHEVEDPERTLGVTIKVKDSGIGIADED